MASSTRGGKRGKKSKALKMYKTPGGAMQYGTPDAFRRAAAAVPSSREYDDKEYNAYDTALAGWAGAMSEKHGADDFSERMERRNQAKVQERKKKSVQNKMYGGKVTKMEGGGKVPSKYKGFSKLPENVQRQMDSGLAEKYEYGGKVGGCRGGGAAIRGTKFSGCK
jgi:hypothetical protein